jgi:hypothetical protein
MRGPARRSFLGGGQDGGFADIPDERADRGFDAEAVDGGFEGEVVAAVLITQRQLLSQIWGLQDVANNYIRVFMVTIRRKLEPDPAHPRYFVTEPGCGVRFLPSGRPAADAAVPGAVTEPQ